MHRFFKWTLYLTTALLGVFALSSGGAHLYFLFAVFFTATAASFLMVRTYAKNLYVVHSVNSKTIETGDGLGIDYRVYNSSYLPLLHAEIVFEVDKKMKTDAAVREIAMIGIQDFLPYEKEFICPYRGFYEVGQVRVTIYDPLMCHVREVVFSKAIRVTVRPKIHPIVCPLIEPKDAYGTLKADKKTLTDETNIANIRKYERGDALKNIHWKLSAKKDELLTKEFEDTVLTRLVVVLDAYKGNFESGMTLALEEQMVSFCASLINSYVQQGTRLRLVWSAKEPVAMDVHTLADFDAAMDALTRFESIGTQGIEETLSSLPETDYVLVITPMVSKALVYEGQRGREMTVYTFRNNSETLDRTTFNWIDDLMDVTYES